jgi:hypothetical protein
MAFGKEDPTEKEKLSRAVQLLDTTKKPLSQVSSEVGYGSTGDMLAAKLVDKGLKTEDELKDRRKAIHKFNEG